MLYTRFLFIYLKCCSCPKEVLGFRTKRKGTKVDRLTGWADDKNLLLHPGRPTQELIFDFTRNALTHQPYSNSWGSASHRTCCGPEGIVEGGKTSTLDYDFYRTSIEVLFPKRCLSSSLELNAAFILLPVLVYVMTIKKSQSIKTSVHQSVCNIKETTL